MKRFGPLPTSTGDSTPRKSTPGAIRSISRRWTAVYGAVDPFEGGYTAVLGNRARSDDTRLDPRAVEQRIHGRHDPVRLFRPDGRLDNDD